MMYLEVLRNKYDQFGGRAGRREFWLFMLVHVILWAVAGVIDSFLFADPGSEWFLLGPIFFIYGMATFVPLIALGARRLHDTGRSGWWQVLIIAWIPTFILTLVTAIVAVVGGSDSDVEIGGSLALIFLVTAIVGTLVLFVFAVLPGDEEDNPYGSPGESPDRPAVYSTVIGSRYAQFTGRAGRKEYWLFALVNWVLYSIFQMAGDAWIGLETNPLTFIYFLMTIVPALALGARRLHDIGRSGWWQLLWLLPIIGWAVLIIFAILPGHGEENSHGPLPETPA